MAYLVSVAGAIPAWALKININLSRLNGWLFILQKGSNMKQTEDAGLVSCGLEEYLINKLDRETNKKDDKKK